MENYKILIAERHCKSQPKIKIVAKVLFAFWLGFLLILSCHNDIAAQVKERTVNTAMSGNQDIVARDAVILAPGFSYTPSSTTSFIARTDPSLICQLSVVPENQIPDPNNKSINTSLPFGYIPGNFSPSPTGGVLYEIPIYTPLGMRNMIPQVSIVYNSHSGNGIMGYGWHLNASSSIQRTNKPFYMEGYVQGVTLTESDQFVLDGVPLVKTYDAQGYTGDIYQTEIESFSSITAMGDYGGSPAWFKVEARDGSVLEYGNGSMAVIANSAGIVVSWLLTKAVDPHGNYIQYEYAKYNPSNQIYIKRINYTGNSIFGIPCKSSINFIYEVRQDKNKLYIGGVEMPQDLILTRITSNSDEDAVRTYDIRYSYSLYSKPIEIIELKDGFVELNRTLIEWGDKPDDYQLTQSYLPILSDKIITSGDLNGDGLPDLILIPQVTGNYSSAHSWELYINNGPLGFSKTDEGPLYSNFKSISIFDKDNDGVGEVYFKEVFIPSYTTTNYVGYKLVDGELVRDTNLDFGYNDFAHPIDAVPGDFDGNGETDFMGLYPNKTIKSFSNINVITLPSFFLPDIVLVIDFNGNGKSDILYANKTLGYIKIYEYNSSSQEFEEIVNYNIAGWHGIQTGDFNGDGKTDLLLITYSMYGVITKVLYSNGMSQFVTTDPIFNYAFSPCQPSYEWYEYPIECTYSINGYDFIVADYNGDGFTDILLSVSLLQRYYDDENTFSEEERVDNKLYLSNGWGFTETSFIFPDEIKQVFTVYDSNYDGNADLLLNIQGTGESTIEFYPENKSHIVKSITDGRNLKLDFDYKRLTDPNVYTKNGNFNVFPLLQINSNYFVLAKAKEIDNNRDVLLTEVEYKYEDLVAHRQGKGLLGFMAMSHNNLTLGLKTEMNFDCNNPFFVSLPVVSKTYQTSTLISEVNTEYSFHSYLNGKKYFAFPNIQSKSDLLNDTYVTDTLVVDQNGNTVYSINTVHDETLTIAALSKQEFFNYDSKGNPGLIRQTRIRDNSTIEQETVLSYYTNGLLKKTKVFYSPTDTIINSFTYDGIGNLLSSTLAAENISMTETFTYEPTFKRFLNSKTNPLNQTTSFWCNPSTGELVSTTDHLALTTTMDYYNSGTKVITSYANGTTGTKAINWALTEPGISALYSIIVEKEGEATSIEYYDVSNRIVRRKYHSFTGDFIQNDFLYDSRGRIFREYDSYYSGESPTTYIQYAYDDYNRITTITRQPSNTSIAYSYSGRTTIINNNGQIRETELDPTGLTIRTQDPGGTITYSYNPDGKLLEIISPSGSTSITYDAYGYQDILYDIDAGEIDYDYSPLGWLLRQEDSKGNILQVLYDQVGRVSQKTWSGGEFIKYRYNSNGQLINTTSGDASISFTYDYLGRTISRIDSIYGTVYSKVISYDLKGNIASELISNGLQVDYSYNNYGYNNLIKVNSEIIWEGIGMNRNGTIDSYKTANRYLTNLTFDQNGLPDKIETKDGIAWIQNWDYDFDPTYGNMTKRKGINSSGQFIEESFSFDDLNRLVEYGLTSNPYSITYDSQGRGNITSKSDIGSYLYDYQSIHRVNEIGDPSPTVLALLNHNIELNSFNKVFLLCDSIELEERTYEIKYGPAKQRVRSILSLDNSIIKSVDYALGSFERITCQGNPTKDIYYIYSPSGLIAAVNKVNGLFQTIIIHSDILGSFDVISNTSGVVLERLSFDAWGRRRNAETWGYSGTPSTFMFDRGFTGHEHLDPFALINMNGRIYDPLIALFLSPDNFIQDPYRTQNYNRYTYCLNNPLIYTDPSGEFIFTALIPGLGVFIDAACWGAVLGGAGYTASVAFSDGGFNNWNWGSFGKSVGIGAISGVVTAGIGNAFGAVGSNGIAGEFARAYTHGFANGMISEFTGGGFMTGFAAGGLGSLGGSAFTAFGGNFAQTAFGQVSFSALAGGVGAELTGGDFWRGAATGATVGLLNHARHIQQSNQQTRLQVKAARAFLQDLGYSSEQVAQDVVMQRDNFFSKYYARLNNFSTYESSFTGGHYDSYSGTNDSYLSLAREVTIGKFLGISFTESYAAKYYPSRAHSIGLVRTGGAHYIEAGLEYMDGRVRSWTGRDNVIYDMHRTNALRYLRYR